MKNFSIMGVHWKIQFLGGGFTKNQYIGWDSLKRWAWTVFKFKRRLSQQKEGCFWGGLIMQCTLWKSTKCTLWKFWEFFTKCEFFRKIRHFWATPKSTCTICRHIYERIMRKLRYERTNKQIISNSNWWESNKALNFKRPRPISLSLKITLKNRHF